MGTLVVEQPVAVAVGGVVAASSVVAAEGASWGAVVAVITADVAERPGLTAAVVVIAAARLSGADWSIWPD